MNVETVLLAVGTVVAGALVAAAVLFQRRDRSLRARLIVLFVTLTLVPSFLTLVALWRELGPRGRLRSAEGVERSMQASLLLARHLVAERHAVAQRLAEAAAARLAGAESLSARSSALSDLAPEEYIAVCFDAAGEHAGPRHGDWTAAQAESFLARIGWPQKAVPALLLQAPDSTHVVVGIAPLAPNPDSEARHRGAAASVSATAPPTTETHVLVAWPVPEAEAQAILAIPEGVRHSKGLSLLEELKLETAARLVGALALVFIVIAVVLATRLARGLTRPIERLRLAFEAVARGQLGHQVQSSPGDRGELGHLTEGFNRMSRELKESKEELMRAARLAAWQDVARRLAHEIKNPLTPITLSIHRIRKRVAEDAVVRECLDTMLEETSHLERLANEFSSFARSPKPVLSRVDPGDILQQVLELYSAVPGVRLGAETAGLPPLLADRDQLRQVFTNLVKNAVEAMPGGGMLDVCWAREDGHVAFTFLDTGCGFGPEALQHLFDPTFTTKPGGSGLGLAIVRRILEDHGGSIEAGNRPEGGAWVRVRLPEAG